MDFFEAYAPDSSRPPLVGVTVREGSSADAVAIGRLIAERNRRPIEDAVRGVADEIDRLERGLTEKMFCVAELDGRALGFGRTTMLPCDDIEGARGLPRGWYLTGVVVEPEFRRRGVGRALTEFRVNWVAQRADEIFYYTSAANGASIALHADYRELTRDFAFPGLTFAGGVGILYSRALAREFRP